MILRRAQRGFILDPYRFGAPGDPSWSSVKLLLHCDGADGTQTSIIDASSIGRTLTVNGNAQNDTGITKFRSAALLCDGTNDNCTAPNSTDFDFSNAAFTIEAWVYPTDVTRVSRIYSNRASSGSDNGVIFYMGATGLVSYVTYNAGVPSVLTYGTALSVNTWQHVYMSSNGTSAFIGHSGAGNSTAAPTIGASNGSCFIASLVSEGALDFLGSIDELRVTKGVCRYTTSYTVPTAAFPAY